MTCEQQSFSQTLYISDYGQAQNILRISFSYKSAIFSFTEVHNVSAGHSAFFFSLSVTEVMIFKIVINKLHRRSFNVKK